MAESSPTPSASYNYPFAASPDIIRSNQKDAYFQGVLLEQLSSVLRKLYGARFAHTYTSEARTFTELLYLGLTTGIGNRTLGEEYCDIVQVEDDTLRLPPISRRAGYILTTILLPYSLNRILPILRRRVRAKLEANQRKALRKGGAGAKPTTSTRLQAYILANLDTITSPSPLYAVSLAVFYFTGAYYHLGKRLWGLRYIFTRRVEESEQRVGYEVLGVLLVLQMAVQSWLHIQTTLPSSNTQTIANAGALAGGSAVLDHGVEVSLDPNAYSSNNALLFESGGAAGGGSKDNLEKITHTPAITEPRYNLKDDETMQWINGRQQRKCTLCLEELKDPSVTTCGHVFCWTCIGDWCREKPECPLCRQMSLVQHILPLRG
ncbi:peroxisome biosynthesis protein-like protein [Aulographum hederae CBS 113979]|uniref:RING-type E3 ubiquitin transferase n=1 Tax=Aulographum hederae CBS 113979 TaxID=1176131 RepID=A0A6G1H3P5_9PEZI|nr:peroxisome biosynthesis protein-like protein [Aulographum hederae CBS 113979]